MRQVAAAIYAAMPILPSLLLLFLISEGAVCSAAAAGGGADYKPTGLRHAMVVKRSLLAAQSGGDESTTAHGPVIPAATSSPGALSGVRDATANTVSQNPKDMMAVLALAEAIGRQAAWSEAQVKLTVKYTLGRTQPPPEVNKSPSPSSRDKGKDSKRKSCLASPSDPTNGTFACGESSLPGTTCNATCDKGFAGLPSATCSNEGAWGAVAGDCIQIVCPGSPPSPDHSSFSCGDSSLPGTTCNASCASGYSGSVSATCGDDGTWQEVPGACTQITCLASPSNPTNGTFACGETSLPGTACNATCDNGFIGSPSASCSSQGVWSAVIGDCKRIVCPGSPPSPEHSSFSCGDSSLPGTTCNASCASGYSGSVSATCGDDGTWQAVAGACTQIMCLGSPANPPNGSFSCGSASPPGSTCKASCATGYIGSPSAACGNNGVWGQVSGNCTKITCPASPPNPTYGVFSCGSSTAAGTACKATCNQAYTGSPSATCGNDGTWGQVVGGCTAAVCIISTFAGTPGAAGFGGDGGPARQAKLSSPWSITFDLSGNLIIADQSNFVLRRVAADTNVISTVAGIPGKQMSQVQIAGSTAKTGLTMPFKAVVDAVGSVYLADGISGRLSVQKINLTSDTFTTVAGPSRNEQFSGEGGPAVRATFWVSDVAVDKSSSFYMADSINHRVYKVTPDGILRTIAGVGTTTPADDNIPAVSSHLSSPLGVALDSSNNIYITENRGCAVRKVDISTGLISTVAGTPRSCGSTGDGGLATKARLQDPIRTFVDQRTGDLYITGLYNVRKVQASTGIITTLAGPAIPSDLGYSGDGGPATSAKLRAPYDVAVAPNGDVYIADTGNHVVRRVQCS